MVKVLRIIQIKSVYKFLLAIGITAGILPGSFSFAYGQWETVIKGYDFTDVHFVNTCTGWVTGENGTLFRTNDGGKTWTDLSGKTDGTIKGIHFTDPYHGWIAGNKDNAAGKNTGMILHSSDGGSDWEPGIKLQPSKDYRDQETLKSSFKRIGKETGIVLDIDCQYFNALDFINPDTGWVVGECGAILHTSNGGTDWMVQGKTIEEGLHDVCFVNDSTGWIVGDKGVIYHTSDGYSWQAQSGGITVTLHAVHFVDEHTGWAAGAHGIILHTNDGGATWYKQSSGTYKTLHDIDFADTDRGWVAGQNGTLLHTADGGLTWQSATTNMTRNLAAIDLTHGTKGMLAGGGTIGQYDTKNKNWSCFFKNPPDSRLHDIDFTNPARGWVVGDNEIIRHTHDSGQTWHTPDKDPLKDFCHDSKQPLNAVHFADNTHGWAVGDRGSILHSGNSGQRWRPQLSGTETDLNDGHFVKASGWFHDGHYGWVAGDSGMILHTDNGGKNWQQQTSGTRVSLNSVHFIDDQQGWMAGGKGTVLHTSNAGKSWQQQACKHEGTFYAIHFVNTSTGWALGDDGVVYHTADGGNTWKLQYQSDTISFFSSVDFTDTHTGWIAGSNGNIFHTENEGKTWTFLARAGEHDIKSIHFAGDSLGWAVNTQGDVYYTQDGGYNWESPYDYYVANAVFASEATGCIVVGKKSRIWRCGLKKINPEICHNNYTANLYAVDFADSLNGWTVGYPGIILHTEDEGNTWQRQSGNTTSRLRSVQFINASTGWTAGGYLKLGQEGVLLYTRNGGRTWHKQLSSDTLGIVDLHFRDSLNGWIKCQYYTQHAGLKDTIYYTSDGGQTWHTDPENKWQQTLSPQYSPEDGAYGLSIAGKHLYYTNDNGSTWRPLTDPVDFSDSSMLWSTKGSSVLQTSTKAVIQAKMQQDSKRIINKLDAKAISGFNNFAFDLYDALVDKENIFCSPLSIYLALSMAYEGAGGNTRERFQECLHISNQKYHDNIIAYAGNLSNRPGDSIELNIANAAWLKAQTPVRKQYKDLISNQYFSRVTSVDFSNAASASGIINDWTSQHTNGLIEQAIHPSAIDKMTQMILTNAIYFYGQWANEFDQEATRPDDFYTINRKKVQTNFMSKLTQMGYFSNEDFKFVSIPYKTGNMHFAMLLPDEKYGIDEIEKKLDHSLIDTIYKKIRHKKVMLEMPKFKFKSNYALKAALNKLGLDSAFTGHADFSGISNRVPLKLNAVNHDAYIKVDEKGTEAAAFTSVSTEGWGAPQHKVFNFKADHPFIFMIIDQKTKVILFIGRYAKP